VTKGSVCDGWTVNVEQTPASDFVIKELRVNGNPALAWQNVFFCTKVRDMLWRRNWARK
jgi:hypothetical protein